MFMCLNWTTVILLVEAVFFHSQPSLVLTRCLNFQSKAILLVVLCKVPGISFQAQFLVVFSSSVSFEKWKDNTVSILQMAKLRCEEALLINSRCQVSFAALHTNLHKSLLHVVRSDGWHPSTCQICSAPRGSLFSCAT